MIIIDEDTIQRIINFIEFNQLNYDIVYNDISKFHIISEDKTSFFFYTYNEEFVIVKYDKNKDQLNRPELNPYEYFMFKTLSAVLEQIKFYDDNLEKSYWFTTTDSIGIDFKSSSYKDDWFEDFKQEAEFSKVEDDDLGYKYFIYDNPKYSPKLKSPYNNLSTFSFINSEEEQYIKVNKLYFEIHPISCEPGNESYLLKLLCNNEEILKEYINYIVSKKRGLKLLIDELFKSIKK